MADLPPDDAFSSADDFNSIDWETWFPCHCYVCHLANRPERDWPSEHDLSERETCLPGCRGCAAESDTTKCGPHCDPARR